MSNTHRKSCAQRFVQEQQDQCTRAQLGIYQKSGMVCNTLQGCCRDAKQLSDKASSHSNDCNRHPYMPAASTCSGSRPSWPKALTALWAHDSLMWSAMMCCAIKSGAASTGHCAPGFMQCCQRTT